MRSLCDSVHLASREKGITMTNPSYMTIDGRQVAIEGEKNLLEIIRKAGIDLPTFCYHSELSVYGACRLCIVEIEGMGTVTSCSTIPREGMVVRTNTEVLRETRKYTVELLLADHNQSCTTCGKSGSCTLQTLTRRLGIREVRFEATRDPLPLDESTPSLMRDPNRCVLCGDCVRVCTEIQGIGAIDFASRGSEVTVGPAFGRMLGDVECVHCGQCARVCPTGAITPKPEIDEVWKAIHDPEQTVVVQVAPAVRVALGESFGMEAGTIATGKMVAALRAIGFDKVYDTSFAADLTVMEEAHEFLARKANGENLPQFTSCCPAWVTFAEQFFPDLLPNVSSCKSPQQMFGALAKDTLPAELGITRDKVTVVSIMPCTAKKAEAKLDKFARNGGPDVDHVLTTQELARMIEETGLSFAALESESLDMPFGFKTGAGVIFGASGGVSEAVARHVAQTFANGERPRVDFTEVRGDQGLREAVVTAGDVEVKLAIVNGLANALMLAERVKAGDCDYDFIEVMACPGGCIGGAGQPVTKDTAARQKRARGLYEDDKNLQLHVSRENPFVTHAYDHVLGEVGGEKAHHLLHTAYQTRRRMALDGMHLMTGDELDKLAVTVCVGTSCHLRGAQKLLAGIMDYVNERSIDGYVDVKATFCMERCDRGPTVTVGERVFERCTLDMARAAIDEEVDKIVACQTVTAQDTPYLTERDFERQVASGLLRFLQNRRPAAATQENTTHGCHGCATNTETGCLHE